MVTPSSSCRIVVAAAVAFVAVAGCTDGCPSTELVSLFISSLIFGTLGSHVAAKR